MDKPWIEIIDEQRLEERVAEEPENANLFGDLPGTTERLFCVQRQTFGLSDIIHGPPKGKRHVTLSLGRRIVAIAGVQVDPRNTALLWVTHVSVEEQHRGHKYGRAIVEAVYEYAVAQNKMVDPSSFTTMGKERIAHIFDELNVRFPQACKRE